MLICDAHTHFFSRQFFNLLADEASAVSGRERDALLSEARDAMGFELPDESPENHAARWILEFDRNGVEHAVVFASAPGESAAVAEATTRFPARLIPYVAADMRSEHGIEAAVEALRSGFRGVLLFPAMQHVDPSDQRLDPLFEEAGSKSAPVVVHCGLLHVPLRDQLGIRPAYDPRTARPTNVVAAAERHRRTRFVLPHFGGGFFGDALMAGAQSRNIYVDTSSSNSWMKTAAGGLTLDEVFARSLQVFGPERILFGTDSSTFPRGWRRDLFLLQLEVVDRLGVEAAAKSRIFGENLLEIVHT